MQIVEMVEGQSGRVLLPRVQVAESFRHRLVGLMGRASLEPGSGMLFPGESSIHMFFMRFAIDVVYLDSDGSVRRIVNKLRPWRISWCPGADAVLEAPPGWAAEVGLKQGTSVRFEEVAQRQP